LAGLGATFVLLAVGVGVLFAVMPPPKRPADAESLFLSVQANSGSAGELLGDTGACQRRGSNIWRCNVLDEEGSGGARYRIAIEPDRSCWTARRTRDYSESGMPARVTGCVRSARWSPWDLFLSARRP
jgi:hypothetical protein